ncbi:cytidylate kinase-like family protein [Pseudoflavonifractor sp. 524-17]|uniref:cytidylate kinase-like family protein n=1 Tax=Pseudoflavonifractor sp. 524-17 TaxID=2304577 RepID=UPI00137AA87E|nr:cytidylate kinase-like family protein [Pseudoflavonifractor sp. 524-17]NCE64015.1 cytidylate kinase-like family protein [Pseudoflavonifractor sp. 524-17]
MKHVVISISRQYGSGGRLVAQRLSEVLNIPFYDKEIIQKVSKETGLTEQYIRQMESKPTGSFIFDLYSMTQTMPLPDQVFIAQSRIIKEAAMQGPCVIVGRCSDYVLDEFPSCLRVFVSAPMAERVRRVRETYQVEAVHMENHINRQDRYRASYYSHFAGKKWGDMSNYDLCVNTRIGVEQAVKVIQTAALSLDGELSGK